VDIHGHVEPAFELVREAFHQALRAVPGSGAALAIWHDGHWIVDLWGGAANAGGTASWQRDSIAQPYSTTKPFAAMCALVLVNRGLLDLDAPVQRYWPEFVAPTTVRHVLSHQAGIVVLDEDVPTETFYDWDRMCSLLAQQEPSWEPGSGLGESALFYGHLVGELVRRVDGRTPGPFLREEICGPAGLDFVIGLGEDEQARAVDLTFDNEEFRRINADGRPELFQRAISNPPGAEDVYVVNSRAWRSAEIPAVNGHGTARGVAGLYAALLRGELLSPAITQEATSAVCSGPDLILGEDVEWGLGFGVDDDGFGMGGIGGSMGVASTRGNYAMGFVPGAIGTFDRADALEGALRSCLGLPPLE